MTDDRKTLEYRKAEALKSASPSGFVVDDRLRELVRLLAQAAAERDYQALITGSGPAPKPKTRGS